MTITSALILSGSIGKGHDSVAAACQAALDTNGIDVETLDCVALLGQTGAAAGHAVFRRLLNVPTVYDGFHFSHLRMASGLARAMEKASSNQLVPKLESQIERREPDQTLVLSVFATGASATERLKQAHPGLASVVLCTDACAHGMWVHDGIDLYLVCSDLAAGTVRRYRPRALVTVVPPPVRSIFYEAPSKPAARASLNLPTDEPCVLLMAGGWGLGPLAESARALSRAGYWVLAVAGSNQRLQGRLARMTTEEPRVRAFGFSESVPQLMAAADVVVTSAGQACNEARVVGRPLVVMDVVPGHGRENTLHELETGGALSCSPTPTSVLGATDAILSDPPKLITWSVQSASDWQEQFRKSLKTGGIELSGR